VIIDSQVHLWPADTPETPWPTDRASSRTQPGSPLEPPEMLDLMDQIGVDRAVIVPPVWAGDDNAPQIEWCRQTDRLGIMGRFDLWDPNRDRLETWLDQPGMIGIRMSYPRDRGREWITDVDAFAWYWAACERLGIPIMLLIQDPSLLVPIAERHPNLTLILDHLALKFQPGERALRSTEKAFEGFDETLALSKYNNVYVKFSSLPVYTPEEYPYPSMTPYLKLAYDAFGPQHIMWGSDVSRLPQVLFVDGEDAPRDVNLYRDCLNHIKVALDFLSDEDKNWILGDTAATALNWH
jgi:predicted TIM-barrel fold metal-dependent hydrolase